MMKTPEKILRTQVFLWRFLNECVKIYGGKVWDVTMIINYRKLWIVLAEKEIDKVNFRKKVNLFPNTMTKLKKNEEVSMQIVLRICEFLECNIGDICDAVPKEGER